MNQNGESKSLSLLSSIVNDNTLAKVKDDLFIGAMRAANNKDELTSLHITDVLNCAGKKGLRWRNEAAAGITRNWSIELEDKAGSSLHEHLQYVIEVYESVRNQGGKLLVHCIQGRSRSVSVCIILLMKFYSMSMSDALTLIRGVREQAQPNFGFVLQLRKIERDIFCSS